MFDWPSSPSGRPVLIGPLPSQYRRADEAEVEPEFGSGASLTRSAGPCELITQPFRIPAAHLPYL